MQEEFNENPYFKQMNEHKKFMSKEEKEIEKYEEDNFTRLNLSKKEKVRLKKKREGKQFSKIDDFKEFDNINELLVNQGIVEKDEKKKTSIKKAYK